MNAEQYGEICDLMWRVSQGMPLADPDARILHTSDMCRAATNRVMSILGVGFEDAAPPPPEWLRAAAAYFGSELHGA